MHLGFLSGRLAFQDLLDQVDAAARTIQLIAQQLIGGASRGTETAMHALTQDGIGLLPFVRVFDKVGEIGLHD